MRATQSQYLSSPIEYLKGVGPQRADTLKKELQVFIFNDLLHHLPFRYIDRTKIYLIKDITDETQFVQLKGKLSRIHTAGNPRQKRLNAWLTDSSGKIELVWFRGVQWVEKLLKEDVEYLIFGKPAIYKNHFSISHPEVEIAETDTESPVAGKLQPVYPSTENLKRKNLDSNGILKLTRTLTAGLVKSDLPEILPEPLVSKF